MEKFMAWIAYQATTLIIGIFCMLLLAHVLVDIARLYEVSLVIALPFVEVFGYVLIARLIIFAKGPGKKELREAFADMDKPRKKNTSLRQFGYSILNSVFLTLMILASWMIAYVAHAMLF